MDESKLKKESMDAVMYTYPNVRGSYQIILRTIGQDYQLKKYATYSYYDVHMKTHVSFRKETECVKIIVESNGFRGNVICSLVCDCDGNEILHSVSAETFENRYEFTFPFSVIYDPRNKPLKDGNLIFRFKFEEIPFLKMRNVDPQSPACISDKRRLMKDMQSFVMRQKLTINANGKGVVVPKALLAARSEFFKESDIENIIKLNASKESMNIAVGYLYTGVLPVLENAENIQELLQIAKVLKIKSLESECLLLARRTIHG